MKKFLSLVLALVMTMSLVTIGASAKTFEDDDAIDYIEAVEVMKAVKVIDGYADGNFNPSATLTRGAAAKIICNMILGPTTAGALSVTEAPFKDVPADNVFAGYIAYCVSEGIISGYADGTFRPAATLTGYAFMKMLLGALGYDAAVEGYSGNPTWSVNVAKRALNIGLADGLINDFNGTKAVTRQEACLFAFNTLKTPMVKYPNSSTVTVGDIVISTSAKAEEVTSPASIKNDLACGNDEVVEFAEKYFGDLKWSVDADDYGRPAHKWKVGKDSVGTYVDDAALIYTAAVKGNVLTDDIDDADLDIADEVSLTINSYVVAEDVESEFKASLESKENMPYTGKGVQYELFTNKDDEIDQIVVIYTTLEQVESIVADKASTKSVNESKLNLVSGLKASAEKLSGDTCKAAGFKDVYGEVKVDDYVLTVPKADDFDSFTWGTTAGTAFNTTSAISIAIPETVKGVMTYKNTASGTVKIDGTSYSVAATATSICDVSDKAAVAYLDSFGYVMMVDGVANTADKSVAVLDIYDTLNKDGKIVPMIKGVTSNGETVTWQVEDKADQLVGGVYTYDEDSNVYTLTEVGAAGGAITEANAGATYAVTLGAEIATSTKKISVGGAPCYFADGVKFIFINAAKGTATVKEGVQKVADGTELAVVINDDGEISTVYVLAAASNSVGTSDALVFLAKETGTVRVYDKVAEEYVTLYTYDAYVNGEKVDDFYADESGCTGFYENEVDTDTGAYVLANNEFAGDEDYQIATEQLTGEDWYKSTKLIVVDSADLAITAKTVFADNTTNEITTLAALKNQVMTEGDDVTVTALYDAETGDALYVYITAVEAHVEG